MPFSFDSGSGSSFSGSLFSGSSVFVFGVFVFGTTPWESVMLRLHHVGDYPNRSPLSTLSAFRAAVRAETHWISGTKTMKQCEKTSCQ